MRLLNISKNTVIAESIKIARTTGERITGLLKTLAPEALLLKTRWGIHTIGMKYPIDCIVLDKEWKVAAVRENMAPRRIFMWNPCYPMVIELPAGTIARSRTQAGDEFELKD